MSYEDLNLLDELRRKGAITEEEYQREKDKVLNNQNNTFSKQPFFGMAENSYLLLMHLSQFFGFIIPGLGFAAPIVMWLLNKDNSANIDQHGKNIVNFMISMFIYYAVAGILCFILIGIPLLILLGIMQFIFIILAALKAGNGEYWEYPLSIKFLQ